MTDLAGAVLAAGWGIVSALVPVVNAEAYAVVVAARSGVLAATVLVLALALGQTAGKVVLFEAAKRGSGRAARGWARRMARRTAQREAGRGERWAERLTTGLARRRTGVPLVLTSAALGLPPLAVVSLAAGAAGQRRLDFVVPCLLGRVARFGAIVAPVVVAMR